MDHGIECKNHLNFKDKTDKRNVHLLITCAMDAPHMGSKFLN